MINWELIRNPYNWLIIILMTAIGALGAQYVFNAYKNKTV